MSENGLPEMVNTSEENCNDSDEIFKKSLCEIRFKRDRFGFYLNNLNLDVKINDRVIVEAERGYDLGIITAIGECAYIRFRSQKKYCKDIKNIIRLTNEEDISFFESNKQKEEAAFKVALKKIQKHDLPMKLVDVEYQLDNNRITFYYIAEHRIDFRELVKDLAHIYHTRIEMRQIGVRDETKRIGGIGVCGREICCASWLTGFEKVSSQYILSQGLTFNSTKHSGQCGRLKCCLMFELHNQNI